MNQNELNEWLQNHPNVKTSESFNIFSLLYKEHDEVRLHSRFISTMLDPNGLHNLGKTPLEKFLKIIGCNKYIEHISKENTTVTPNSKNWTEEQKIDILIEDQQKKFAIIIENKIFASDSNHVEEKDESDNAPKNNEGQLERYYRYITTGITPNEKEKRIVTYNSDQVEIYYLTLDRHRPSDVSLGLQLSVKGDNKSGTKEINLIEYKEEICNWLDELLKEDITIDVRSAITQYISLVKNLTGNLELNEKLFEFVGKKENWEDACNIFRLTEKEAEKLNGVEKLLFKNRKHVYWHALAAFFDELITKLKAEDFQKIGISDLKTSDNLTNCISDIIHRNKKDVHPYIGFRFKNIWWTIQLNEISKCFMLGIDKENNVNIDNIDKLKNENEITNDMGGWRFVVSLKPIVNPWNFAQGQTFDLLNRKKRQDLAKQYATFVEEKLEKINTFCI